MAHEPFSVRVASPQWRATVLAWIERSLAEQDIAVTGEPDQLRMALGLKADELIVEDDQ